MVQAIRDASESLYDLLENLLYWARSQQRSIVLKLERFDLSSLVRDTVTKLFAEIHQKNLKVNIQIPQGLMMLADKELLRIVLRNLLSNAVKYSRVSTEISIVVETPGKELIIRLENTGRELPGELFQMLKQQSGVLPEMQGRTTGGTGVGLPLCIDFIRRHGGSIEAASQLLQATADQDQESPRSEATPSLEAALGQADNTEQQGWARIVFSVSLPQV